MIYSLLRAPPRRAASNLISGYVRAPLDRFEVEGLQSPHWPAKGLGLDFPLLSLFAGDRLSDFDMWKERVKVIPIAFTWFRSPLAAVLQQIPVKVGYVTVL